MAIASGSTSALGMSGATGPSSASGSKDSGAMSPEADEFDIVGAYERALQDDKVGSGLGWPPERATTDRLLCDSCRSRTPSLRSSPSLS